MKKKRQNKKLSLKKKTISDLLIPGYILGGANTRINSPQQSGSPCGSCMLACQTDGCRPTRYCA